MKRGLKIALIALGAVLILGAGAGAYLFFIAPARTAQAAPPEEEEAAEAKPEEIKAVEEAGKLAPVIRHVVVGHLRTRTAAELGGAQERLAEELTAVLTPILKENLRKIFITDLIIQ